MGDGVRHGKEAEEEQAMSKLSIQLANAIRKDVLANAKESKGLTKEEVKARVAARVAMSEQLPKRGGKRRRRKLK